MDPYKTVYLSKVCVGQGHVSGGLTVSVENLSINAFGAYSYGQTDSDETVTDFCSPRIQNVWTHIKLYVC